MRAFFPFLSISACFVLCLCTIQVSTGQAHPNREEIIQSGGFEEVSSSSISRPEYKLHIKTSRKGPYLPERDDWDFSRTPGPDDIVDLCGYLYKFDFTLYIKGQKIIDTILLSEDLKSIYARDEINMAAYLDIKPLHVYLAKRKMLLQLSFYPGGTDYIPEYLLSVPFDLSGIRSFGAQYSGGGNCGSFLRPSGDYSRWFTCYGIYDAIEETYRYYHGDDHFRSPTEITELENKSIVTGFEEGTWEKPELLIIDSLGNVVFRNEYQGIYRELDCHTFHIQRSQDYFYIDPALRQAIQVQKKDGKVVIYRLMDRKPDLYLKEETYFTDDNYKVYTDADGKPIAVVPVVY